MQSLVYQAENFKSKSGGPQATSVALSALMKLFQQWNAIALCLAGVSLYFKKDVSMFFVISVCQYLRFSFSFRD